MKLEDVMTLQEAAERWGVTADALKQNCRGRVKNGFLPGEFRKSGKNWLVTRSAMERLYGGEKIMLKVYDHSTSIAKKLGTVDSYKEAWELIEQAQHKESNTIGKWDKQSWDESDMDEEYPGFEWPKGVDYVWCAEWVAWPVNNPEEYTKESVLDLISALQLSYKIEEID